MNSRALLMFLVVAALAPFHAAAAGTQSIEPAPAFHLGSFIPELPYTTPDPQSATNGGSETRHARAAVRGNYDTLVEQAAREYNVDAALIHAIIRVESAHQPAAVSPKGAVGLMQVMPQTAERFGKVNLLDPEQNIRTGTRYLRILQQLFKHELDLVLAAYNAGENAVARFGRVPPYPQTQAYVKAVTKLYEQYRGAAQALR